MADRLWDKIERRGSDECWPWLGYRDDDGYGRLRVGRTNRVASALVLEEVSGEPANGRLAMHSCDHPWCCNGAHLSWGTHRDNHADRGRKGRQARGSHQGNAKLTEAQVAAIRIAYVPRSIRTGRKPLAVAYNVSKDTIASIVRYAGWR